MVSPKRKAKTKPKRKSNKPAWGYTWQSSDTVDLSTLFSEKDLKAIGRSLGLRTAKQVDDFAGYLEMAVNGYYFAQHHTATYPTHRQVKAALLEIHDLSEPLAWRLRKMDSISAMWLRNSLRGLYDPFQKESSNDHPRPDEQRLVDGTGLEGLASDLEYLAGCLKELTSGIKVPSRGRKQNLALTDAIVTLEYIYEIFTQTKARSAFTYSKADKEYGGPFFIFANMCVQRIDPRLQLSNNALGEHIRRSLGWRRS